MTFIRIQYNQNLNALGGLIKPTRNNMEIIKIEKFPSIEGVAKDFAKRAVEGCKDNIDREKCEKQIAFAVDYGHENAWQQLETMDFGDAIRALKAGAKVARKGWNGKGMFLFWLKPAATVKAEWCKDPILKGLAEANDGKIEALGTICMFTAQKQILSGWLASQTDVLAEDWVIISE